MKTIKDSRAWLLEIDERNHRIVRVSYTLYFDGSKLVDIENEYGFRVEKTSECWEFFQRKYSKQLQIS